MGTKVLQLNAKDNVLVALSDLRQGQEIAFGERTYRLKTDVPAKHKFVTEEIGRDGAVVMYGVLIGKAMEPIAAGERVTTRNTHHEAAAFHEKTEEYRWQAPDVAKWRDRTFLGFHREDRQVATRNYWLVAPVVFCENRNILALKQAFEEELGFAADAGQDGWGAAATAASGVLGGSFLLLLTVPAALAYSIAGSGNSALIPGFNELAWAGFVMTSFPRAMLIMAGSFGLWRAS